MKIVTLSDLKLPVSKDESALLTIAEKKFGKKIKYFKIRKKSLDARDKENLRYVYTVECGDTPYQEPEEVIERLPDMKKPQKPVIVVGSGPAGLFCALRLIERGILPIVIERGDSVKEREQKINRFFKENALDVDSNVQFGEGGAGTFSDGKLNTQTHNPLQKDVFKTFVKFGAPEEIAWLNKPHIGSDNLKKVVENMREYILSKGGKVYFRAKLTDVQVKDGRIKSATIFYGKEKREEKIEVSALVLAIGHSARDTVEMLLSKGVFMSQKDFAVGVRIEHLQKDIGYSQYGRNYTLLPAADYKLVSHAGERAVFTFCMCPGGYVMAATSEENAVVTNGMSNYARNGENANSALIAQVGRADFANDSPMAGIEFQRELERAAFKAGGENYRAPVQLVGDFLKDRVSDKFGEVTPTYANGTTFSDMRAVLPKGVISALKAGLLDMDKRLKGFASSSAVLTGVESRTSSPVRIERDESFQSVSVKGIFPCGEGAGYAGGITSSAVDGIKVADAVYKEFLNA